MTRVHPIRRRDDPRGLRPALPVALSAVVAALVILLTGGQNSPWTGLLFLPVVLAAFTSLAQAIAIAALASVLFLGIVAWRPGVSPLWSLAHVLLLFLVGAVTGVLVQRHAQRLQRRETEAAEAQSALDIQHMINTAYDLTVTLDLVILKQRELLRADSYAVLLADNNTLRVRVSSGVPPEGLETRLSIHDEDHGWCPADGRPLVIADARASRSRLAAIDPAARSILVIPLHSVERLVGLLFFGSREPNRFGPAEIDHAEDFANRIVFPIQRAQLEEDLRRLAFTDAQTSLYNHRHFQGQLEEEVRRAQRYGRPVSVILMDIDNFKQFNDRYGHPAGDRLLRELAGTITDTLRSVDIAARYGGEEFVVICPETNREQAAILAERLRVRIDETSFDIGDAEPHHVTVSMGVAAFPENARTKGELVDAADQALYEAKRGGKNRIVSEPAG